MGASINGTELEWRDQGQGDPILMLHGFPLNSAMWGGQLAALAGSWRVIAPDLRGFGASDTGSDPVIGMDLMARDVAGLMDHLGIGQAVVCGISMGGYVAFELLRQFPDRVRALALCDTRAGPDSPDTRRARAALAERVIAEDTIEPVIQGLLPRMLSARTARRNPGVVAMVQVMMKEASPDAVARALQGMAARNDSEPLLRSVQVPTVVIVGSDDVITDRGEAEMLARGIRGARLEVIEAAGHMPPIEQPDEFNHILNQFLKDLPKDTESTHSLAY